MDELFDRLGPGQLFGLDRVLEPPGVFPQPAWQLNPDPHADVPGTELGSILCTRESGAILFFSMATSFTAAALGAEGVGRATTMVIGNGHMPDMGLTALSVLRDNRNIREIFEQRYGAP